MSIRPQGPPPRPRHREAPHRASRDEGAAAADRDGDGLRRAGSAWRTRASADLILVGDSAAMTVYRPRVDRARHDGRDADADARRHPGRGRPLVVADMPFGSFQVSGEDALRNAIRFVKEGEPDAVKLEGAGIMLSRVRAIVGAGIPVMGHLGLTPQSATMLGGFKAQGRSAPKALALLSDSRARGGGLLLARAGGRPRPGGATGLGAPGHSHDRDRRRGGLRRAGHSSGTTSWGCTRGVARFVKRYAEVGEIVRAALAEYAADVRARRFPEERHTYAMPEAELALFEQALETTPEAEPGSSPRASRTRPRPRPAGPPLPRSPPASAASPSRGRPGRPGGAGRATMRRRRAARRGAPSPRPLVRPPGPERVSAVEREAHGQEHEERRREARARSRPAGARVGSRRGSRRPCTERANPKRK